MKYSVTYCITHPDHTPTTSTGTVEARTRLELDAGLNRGIARWKKRGYAIEIVKVTWMDDISQASGLAHSRHLPANL
jgi:hypothetical protein